MHPIWAELVDVDDSGPVQTGTYLALSGERYTGVRRVQGHGLSTHPAPGAQGLLLFPGGHRDRAVAIGHEGAARQRALAAGGSVIYDQAGNIVSVVAAKIRIVHSGAIEIVAPEVTITGNLRVTGAVLTHNAKNIGSTHVHTGVIAGPANTGAPA